LSLASLQTNVGRQQEVAMRVEVEVPVIGWGQMKAGQSNKDIFASVPKTFEIPEYDLSEVPLVLAYSETHKSGKTSRSEYFGHAGKLYRDHMVDPNCQVAKSFHFQHWGTIPHPYFAAVSERYRSRIHSLRKESEALAPKKMIPTDFGEHVVKGDGNVPIRIQTMQELGIKNYNEMVVEEQISEFAKRMERMIIVGGNLMVEEQEPIIRINGYLGSGPYSAGKLAGYVHLRPETDRLVKPESWSSTTPLAYVSLAEIGTLENRVAALEACVSGNVQFEYGISDVEIEDARYMKTSGEGATLMAVADLLRRVFVQNMMPLGGESDYQYTCFQKTLMETSLTVLAEMQRMISALNVATETEIPQMLEESVAAILEMHSRNDLLGYFGNRHILEYAAHTLELWQDREIGLEMVRSPAIRT
jgi:hypothetical protein